MIDPRLTLYLFHSETIQKPFRTIQNHSEPILASIPGQHDQFGLENFGIRATKVDARGPSFRKVCAGIEGEITKQVISMMCGDIPSEPRPKAILS
jgi:hypothetical protein